MRIVELSNNQFNKIKEVSSIDHITDIGTQSSLFCRINNKKLESNQFITNFKEKLYYRGCYTDIDSILDDLYSYQYDIVTVPKDKIDYVNNIINPIKELVLK